MKRGPFLLDAGFLVALTNDEDRVHAACAAAWKEVRGPFVTTEGVIVEAAWLLRKNLAAVHACVNLLSTVHPVVAAPTPWRCGRALELMRTYRDVPMDLVDGLLVALSEEHDCRDVLTVDVRGFSTYRSRGKPFRRLP